MLALLVAGCGGGSGEGGFADPEAEAVATAIRSAAAAAAAGHGEEACSHLSPRGLRQVEALLRERREVSSTDCAGAVEEAVRRLPGTAIDALNRPVVSNVRVDGERATANVEPPADLKELALAAGYTDVVAEVRLVKRDGRWLVDGGRL